MDWHIVSAEGEPQFQSGWQNFINPEGVQDHRDCAFRLIDTIQCVQLIGMASQGTVGNMAPVYTLPEGYRATHNIHLPVVSGLEFGYLHINANGEISVHKGSAWWIDFSGIIFSIF